MPDWKQIVRSRVASLRLSGAAEFDLVEELAAHLGDRYEELCSGGLAEQEAYRQVLSELSDAGALQVAIARSRQGGPSEAVPVGGAQGSNLLVDLAKDLQYALRTLKKNPLFTLFVLVILGLGSALTRRVHARQHAASQPAANS